MGTKQDPCHLGQGCPDDEASYGLDVHPWLILFRMPGWPGLLVSIQGASHHEDSLDAICTEEMPEPF